MPSHMSGLTIHPYPDAATVHDPSDKYAVHLVSSSYESLTGAVPHALTAQVPAFPGFDQTQVYP